MAFSPTMSDGNVETNTINNILQLLEILPTDIKNNSEFHKLLKTNINIFCNNNHNKTPFTATQKHNNAANKIVPILTIKKKIAIQ